MKFWAVHDEVSRLFYLCRYIKENICVTMTLKHETKIGLTFGQIISVLSIMGAIVGIYIALNIRVAQAEIRITNNTKQINSNTNRIEKIYDQNREDFKNIIDRLDDIRDKLDTKADKQR